MIISVGNFKGGVGKTTIVSLISYILANQKNKKVLLIDTDQQGDLTSEVEKTYNVDIDRSKNIFNACFDNQEISNQVQSLNENISILAGSSKMRNFTDTVKSLYNKKSEKNLHHQILAYIIDEINNDYDFILLDTNPAVDLLTDNILYASDYALIPTKSLPRDSDDTKVFYNYLIDNIDKYNFSILGVLAYLFEDSSTNQKILEDYNNVFDDLLFENIIKNSAVVHRWSSEGITTDKPYDKKTLLMYENVTDEFLMRLEYLKEGN